MDIQIPDYVLAEPAFKIMKEDDNGELTLSVAVYTDGRVEAPRLPPGEYEFLNMIPGWLLRVQTVILEHFQSSDGDSSFRFSSSSSHQEEKSKPKPDAKAASSSGDGFSQATKEYLCFTGGRFKVEPGGK